MSAASVPKNGGAASLLPNQGWCAGTSTNYDGTSMTTDGSNVYAASWSNIFFGEIHVFKNGVKLANPFDGKAMGAHPIFVKSKWGLPTVIAPDSGGHFWVTTFGNQWAAALEIPSPGWFPSLITDRHLSLAGRVDGDPEKSGMTRSRSASPT